MSMARKRRGRGEGGVYQRGDGLWVGSVSMGYDGNGKRLRRVVYGATKKEAQDELRKLQNDAANGVGLAIEKPTLGEWLTRWLALVKPSVEPNTYRFYEVQVRLHIVPHIGHIQVAKLAAVHVQGLYSTLTATGVSPAIQRKAGLTLTISLNEAVRLNMIPGNVAEKVRKPKAAKAEIQVFDPEQVRRFLQAARESRHYPLYLTALDSGVRPGELLALRWEDVDFEGGFLSITKSLEEINGVVRVKATKTQKGRRRVDLSAETLAVLAEHRKAALAAGRITAPVFHNIEGGYLLQSNLLQRSFKAILTKAGLPSVGLYTLRHTCATLLLLADVPAKVVSERLGHANIAITLDTYSHVLPSMQKRAASVLGAILGSAENTVREAK
jgi:integrase